MGSGVELGPGERNNFKMLEGSEQKGKK